MDKNEIKKRLYKEKPEATLIGAIIGFKIYSCKTSQEELQFRIPEDEADQFGITEPAQLLIRWMV